MDIPANARAVTIDDIDYPTISGASRETGIHHTVIRRHLAAGTEHKLNNWSGRGTSIEVGDYIYPSVTEAAADTGYSRQWIHKCRKEGRLAELKPRRG